MKIEFLWSWDFFSFQEQYCSGSLGDLFSTDFVFVQREFDISFNLMMSLWNDGCYCHQGVGGKKQGQGASVNININISISINININANININVSISIKINITSSDDAKYIQQWRERALKAQGRPIPKIGSRLLISSSYIQQDFYIYIYADILRVH